MKVIHLEGGFVRGQGITTSIATLLKEINSRHNGITLEVLCNESNGVREDGLPPNVTVTQMERRKFLGYHHFALYPELFRLAASDDKIVHIHNPTSVWPLLKKKGRRVITWHGNNNQNWNSPGFGSFPKRILRRGFLDLSTYMLRELDKVITISDFLRNDLVNYFRLPSKLVERVYWGTDVDTFKPANVDGGYMLFVGRHVPYKGIQDLVDLSHELKFPLVVAGDGIEKDRLEEYAKQKGAPVKFMGKVPLSELIRLYQGCSFYITASRWEGFGLPLIEAGSSGKPVIAPDNSAHPEVVVDSKTGLIYRNKGELLAAAKSLVDDPIKRVDLGFAARAHVMQKFDMHQTADRYMQIYRSL